MVRDDNKEEREMEFIKGIVQETGKQRINMKDRDGALVLRNEHNF